MTQIIKNMSVTVVPAHNHIGAVVQYARGGSTIYGGGPERRRRIKN